MRNRVFGGIGFAWGALILIRFFLYPAQVEGVYQAGQYTGVALGIALMASGFYYMIKKPNTSKKS